ncbi:MAG: hypothetical protein AB1898_08505 [Acidobacteriota bacterium]
MPFKTIACFLFYVSFGGAAGAEGFEFRVKHDHLLGSCDGQLIANDGEIRYEAANGRHSQTWAYADIQKLDVASVRQLVLETFQSQSWKMLGRDKVLEFTLVEAQLTPQHQEFLRKKLTRPMVARLVEKAQHRPATLLVRHRHRLGGCGGRLEIGEDRMIYSTAHASDNRVWKLSEIETIGSPDPYHLRVTTYNETFTFDLKSPLDTKLYDSLWKRIYRLGSVQVSGHEPGE